MLKEFREFIARGNVMELAVAVILGAAFGAIVNSLVTDVITPALLNPALEAAGVARLAELTWNGVAYGSFLAAVLSFLVIAFVVFLIVRTYNNFMKRFEKPKAEEPPAKTREEILLEEIRDLLAKRPL
jgi:large conductance mechanosensitive channel